MRARVWIAYTAAAAAGVLAYLFGARALGHPTLSSGPAFNLIGASSVVAILLGTRLHRPARRLPWYLFALGQALFVSGDVLAYNYQRFFGAPLPFPSVADAAYLAVYPPIVAGILILIRTRNPGRDWASLIDAGVIAVGLAVPVWVFLIAPYAHDSTLHWDTKLTSIAYPAMDVLVLVAAVRMAVGAGRREPSFHLMIGALVALLASDSIYGWLLLHGGYETGGLLDGGWCAFYVLFGAAALHPSMRSISEASARNSKLTRRRLALLGAATLIAPGVAIYQAHIGESSDVLVVQGAAIALFLLVVARIAGLVSRLEETLGLESALREAGATLATATSRNGIFAAARDAAAMVAGETATSRVYRIRETAGADAGASLSGADLHPELGRRLLAGEAVEGRPVDLPGLPADAGAVFMAPLLVRGGLEGVLAVAHPDGVAPATRSALQTLCYQIALALESAALTEDLVRRQSEARFASLVQHSSDVIAVVSPDTTIRYVTPSVVRILGRPSTGLQGRPLSELVDPPDVATVLLALERACEDASGEPSLLEFGLLRADGLRVDVETYVTNLLTDPNLGGIVLNIRDVSERRAFERQLAHQAFHDSITGLANRALFHDRVDHALSRRAPERRAVTVLFMDLDDFKTVNDSLGHAAGDALLAEVAARLRACLRNADTAARLGGDEFGILLDDGEQVLHPEVVAERIGASLAAPFVIDDSEVFVRASIGIVRVDGEAEEAPDAEELLRNADVAMYTAKARGKGQYQIFEQRMHDEAVERLQLKADLQLAVERDELFLEYQPIMDLERETMAGVEALVRWTHPRRGPMPPAAFIPIAEDTGLILDVGRWVLRRACDEVAELQRTPGREAFTLSVNLSARQLQHASVVDDVRRALADSGLPPELLVLEITESVMMQDVELSMARLEELKALGVQLAVDDFGTGYSSLNYLRRFPVDVLKVDKSFIDAVAGSGEEADLTAAIVDLSRVLRLRPVAEGIEDARQLERLRELRCGFGQGFLFARPLSLHALDAWMRSADAGDERLAA